MSTKPICLIGFMGVGKTRWGKQLANRLKFEFSDLDKVVEAKGGMSIPDIFRLLGEDHFRTIETECLREVLSKEKCVISLGGGTPCNEINLNLLKQNATSIYLKSNAGMLYSRLINNYKSRPLLASQKEENLLPFIQNLLAQREPFYHQADTTVEIEGLTIEKLAGAVLSN